MPSCKMDCSSIARNARPLWSWHLQILHIGCRSLRQGYYFSTAVERGRGENGDLFTFGARPMLGIYRTAQPWQQTLYPWWQSKLLYCAVSASIFSPGLFGARAMSKTGLGPIGWLGTAESWNVWLFELWDSRASAKDSWLVLRNEGGQILY